MHDSLTTRRGAANIAKLPTCLRVGIARPSQRTNRRVASPPEMDPARYSVYVVEKGGKFVKSDDARRIAAIFAKLPELLRRPPSK